jgi:hypothetical protein
MIDWQTALTQTLPECRNCAIASRCAPDALYASAGLEVAYVASVQEFLPDR